MPASWLQHWQFVIHDESPFKCPHFMCRQLVKMYLASLSTSRPKRSRFCHIFLVQSLVWKYCLKLEGCLHNFFLIGPHSAAAEPNSAPKIVTQFLEPSLVVRRRFCLNVRILRMPLNPRKHRCKYSRHSWSLVAFIWLILKIRKSFQWIWMDFVS